MVVILIPLTVLANIAGLAAERRARLAVISSDYVSKTYDLSLVINELEIIQNIRVKNNKKNRTKIYSLEKLKDSITLVKAAGIRLVTLTCHNFDPKAGCDLEIEYPYNITYGKFKKFHAKLKRNGNEWGLYRDNKRFTTMKLVAKKFLGLLIGIKRIELN
jgi:hypothetical protein